MSLAAGVGIGLVAGAVSGMLGIGGGAVLVPGMVLLLDVEQHAAQGISLAVIAMTALVGGFTHYWQGNVRLGVVLGLAPAAALFALGGGFLANEIPAHWLSRTFGLLSLAMAVRIMWPRQWPGKPDSKTADDGGRECQR